MSHIRCVWTCLFCDVHTTWTWKYFRITNPIYIGRNWVKSRANKTLCTCTYKSIEIRTRSTTYVLQLRHQRTKYENVFGATIIHELLLMTHRTKLNFNELYGVHIWHRNNVKSEFWFLIRKRKLWSQTSTECGSINKLRLGNQHVQMINLCGATYCPNYDQTWNNFCKPNLETLTLH